MASILLQVELQPKVMQKPWIIALG